MQDPEGDANQHHKHVPEGDANQQPHQALRILPVPEGAVEHQVNLIPAGNPDPDPLVAPNLGDRIPAPDINPINEARNQAEEAI